VDVNSRDVARVTTLRCKSSRHSCEPCWSTVDCWISKGRFLHIQTIDTTWDHHILTVHLHREISKVLIGYEILDLFNASLDLFFNGQPVHRPGPFKITGLELPARHPEQNLSLTPSGRSGIAELPLTHAGGHELELQFSPSKKMSTASVKLGELPMTGSYCKCQDSKVCISVLAELGEAGWALRNSNDLKRRCLEANMTTMTSSSDYACKSWRMCLTQSREPLETNIKSLLDASSEEELDKLQGGLGDLPDWSGDNWDGYGSSAPVAFNTLGYGSSAPVAFNTLHPLPSQNGTNSTSLRCMNPAVEDVLSWHCDCAKQMRSTCKPLMNSSTNVTMKLCMRAIMCLHQRVCLSWKNTACQSPALQGLLAQNGSLAKGMRQRSGSVGKSVVSRGNKPLQAMPSLLERSGRSGDAAKSDSASGAMDYATRGKSCQ